MDDITLPRSFEDTTPAEMLKDYSRKRKTSPSPSRSPILEVSRQQSNYQTISPTSSRPAQQQQHAEEEHEEQEDVPEHQEQARSWFGKRIWNSLWEWEKNNLELVLENKQSVARDHLGLSVNLTMLSCSE